MKMTNWQAEFLREKEEKDKLYRACGEMKKQLHEQALEIAELEEYKVKYIPKLAHYIEPFGKFKCPSCGELYNACYDDETGEPLLWFNHCPDCGQVVITKDNVMRGCGYNE